MIDLVTVSAAVAVMTTLITISKLFQPVRYKLPEFNGLFSCPICLGFWVAAPWSLYEFGLDFKLYLCTVALSNVWMLLITKLYVELELLNGD